LTLTDRNIFGLGFGHPPCRQQTVSVSVPISCVAVQMTNVTKDLFKPVCYKDNGGIKLLCNKIFLSRDLTRPCVYCRLTTAMRDGFLEGLVVGALGHPAGTSWTRCRAYSAEKRIRNITVIIIIIIQVLSPLFAILQAGKSRVRFPRRSFDFFLLTVCCLFNYAVSCRTSEQ
jgi:hypothetical protein